MPISRFWENTIGNSRLFGFVSFSDPEPIDDAVREISVNFAETLDLKSTLAFFHHHPLFSRSAPSLTLVLVSDTQLNFVSLGHHQVFLLRQSQITRLINFSDSVTTITGPYFPEDKLLFTTEAIIDYSHPEKSGTLVPLSLSSPNFHLNHSAAVVDVLLKRRHFFNVLIGAILLIALIFASFYGYRRQRQADKQAKFSTIITAITQKIKTEPKEAQRLLAEAQKLSLDPDKLTSLAQQIEDTLLKTGANDRFTLPVFYDTSLIISNPQFSRLSLFDSNLYLLSSEQKRLDQINLTEKSTKLISQLDGLKDIISFTVESNNKISGITANSLVSITKTDIKESVHLNFVPADVRLWGGNLYLLDSSQKMIWKFTTSSLEKWLKDNQSLPENPINFAVNGQVWVVNSQGFLAPYTRGKSDNFSSPNLQTSSIFHLDLAQEKDILVLSDHQFVYVLTKKGEVIGKYNFFDKNILSFVYHEPSNSVFVLCADQKIYQISL